MLSTGKGKSRPGSRHDERYGAGDLSPRFTPERTRSDIVAYVKARADRATDRREPLNRSPDFHALVRRQVQLLARLHVERRIPGVEIAHGLRAELAGGMAVGRDPAAQRLVADLGAQAWAKAMKKRWSPVKPSITGAGLPPSDAL